jgi:hypothetical protein
MARRPCPHCGESIQNAARICRFCRHQVPPIPGLSRGEVIGAAFLGAAVLFGAFVLLRHTTNAPEAPRPEPRAAAVAVAPPSAKRPPSAGPPSAAPPTAESVADVDVTTNISGAELARLLADYAREAPLTFGQLSKNPDRYAKRPWSFSGQIVEITEKDGSTVARVALDDWAQKVIFVAAKFETDFTQGDRVDVAGRLAGTFSYESQAGWNITIPAMVALSMQKRGTFARLLHPHRRAPDDDGDE